MTVGTQMACSAAARGDLQVYGGITELGGVGGSWSVGRDEVVAGELPVPASCPSLAACSKQIRYVTHNGAGPHTSFNPSWSPDGRRIAYTEAQFPAGKPAIGDIWTISPDGHGRPQVSHSSRS
jgi:hypothetical protein